MAGSGIYPDPEKLETSKIVRLLKQVAAFRLKPPALSLQLARNLQRQSAGG